MGKKLLTAGSGVALFAVMGYIFCLFMPLNKTFFKVAGFKDVLTVVVYSLTVHYDFRSRPACLLVRVWASKPDLCDQDDRGDSSSTSSNLQDASSTFCSAVVSNTLQGSCNAFTSAYIMGIILVFITVANLIMQGVGLFLVQEYMKKPKKQYRETAFFLDLIGGVLMLVAVIIYWPTAILGFDSMTVLGGVGDVFFGPSDSIGTSWGYIMFYFFILIQAISIILLGNGSNSSEVREAELREQRKFMQEMEMFQQATEMTQPGYGGNHQVTAPPNHWQGGGAWGGAPDQGQNYGYGGQPMMQPPMGGMQSMGGMQPPMPPMGGMPNMPPMYGAPPPAHSQQMGGGVPYF